MTTQEKTDQIITEIKACHEKGEPFRKSTAPVNYGGWDSEVHSAMFGITDAYRDKGHRVNMSVNHGVADWIILPKITVNI